MRKAQLLILFAIVFTALVTIYTRGEENKNTVRFIPDVVSGKPFWQPEHHIVNFQDDIYTPSLQEEWCKEMLKEIEGVDKHKETASYNQLHAELFARMYTERVGKDGWIPQGMNLSDSSLTFARYCTPGKQGEFSYNVEYKGILKDDLLEKPLLSYNRILKERNVKESSTEARRILFGLYEEFLHDHDYVKQGFVLTQLHHPNTYVFMYRILAK